MLKYETRLTYNQGQLKTIAYCRYSMFHNLNGAALLNDKGIGMPYQYGRYEFTIYKFAA